MPISILLTLLHKCYILVMLLNDSTHHTHMTTPKPATHNIETPHIVGALALWHTGTETEYDNAGVVRS